MAGKLIMLPLRVSLRSAHLLTRATVDLAGRTAVDRLSTRSRSSRRVASIAPAPTARRRPSTTTISRPRRRASRLAHQRRRHRHQRPTPPAARPARPAPRPEPPTPLTEPAHVSEEPALVETSAEPGAEDGAGAAITVLEPWAGYGRMNARDVIDRREARAVAELAAIELYETRHRARQTVLAAVERQLKLADVGRPA